MSKPELGHIDCPACGQAKGVRVTADKNGEPFGFCANHCGLQLRIGGNAARVAAFVRRYPWAGAGQAQPAAAPAPAAAAAPPAAARAPTKVPPKVVVPPAPAAQRSSLDDALAIFGGRS